MPFNYLEEKKEKEGGKFLAEMVKLQHKFLAIFTNICDWHPIHIFCFCYGKSI